VNCYWSCSARELKSSEWRNPQRGRIWRISGISWTSEENSVVPRRIGRWETRVAILEGVIFYFTILSILANSIEKHVDTVGKNEELKYESLS